MKIIEAIRPVESIPDRGKIQKIQEQGDEPIPYSSCELVYDIPDGGLEIVLPFTTNGTYDLTVDWGDGGPTDAGTDPSDTSWYTHTFANATGDTIQRTVTVDGNGTHFSQATVSTTIRHALRSANLGNLGWTDLQYGFLDNENLDSVEIPNTAIVTNMKGLFSQCDGAISVDTSGWDTSNVTDMSWMFFMTGLMTPDVSNWDVSSVETIEHMFNNADAAEPDVSSWTTSSMTVTKSAFANINFNPVVDDWDMSNVTNMSSMFYSNTLANPDTSGWDLSNVTNVAYAFNGCTGMTNAVSAAKFWNNPSITTYSYCFSGATNIINYSEIPPDWGGPPACMTFTYTVDAGQEIRLPFSTSGAYVLALNWDDGTTGNVFSGSAISSYTHTFTEAGTYNVTCTGTASHISSSASGSSAPFLVAADLGNMQLSNVQMAFFNCTNLTSVINLDTAGLSNLNYLFYGCSSLVTSDDVSGWDLSNITIMQVTFGATSLNPDVSGWDMSGVQDITGLFLNNTAFNQDLSSWDLSSCTTAAMAFMGCTAMNTTVPAEQFWNNGTITSYANCFTDAINIDNYASIPSAWK